MLLWIQFKWWQFRQKIGEKFTSLFFIYCFGINEDNILIILHAPFTSGNDHCVISSVNVSKSIISKCTFKRNYSMIPIKANLYYMRNNIQYPLRTFHLYSSVYGFTAWSTSPAVVSPLRSNVSGAHGVHVTPANPAGSIILCEPVTGFYFPVAPIENTPSIACMFVDRASVMLFCCLYILPIGEIFTRYRKCITAT